MKLLFVYKVLDLCLCRWAQLRMIIDEIETNVEVLRVNHPVSYKTHIGGGYYVSITSGFNCIDIRKFYLPYGQTDHKPTRRGIALRLGEWTEIKKIINTINDKFPTLGTTLPCFYNEHHLDPLVALQCRDCHPFMN